MTQDNIAADPIERSLDDIVSDYLATFKPYQELINHVMKPRDGYFELVSKFNQSDITAINRLREELEYYEGLWNEARKICHKHGLEYREPERHSAEIKEESSAAGT